MSDISFGLASVGDSPRVVVGGGCDGMLLLMEYESGAEL